MASCARLRHEHDVIGGVLAAVSRLIERSDDGSTLSALALSGAVEFFSAFVEGMHEAKEEQALFPLLAARDDAIAAVVERVQAEHADGRRLLAALRPLCSRRRVAADAGRLFEAYVEGQRRHMAFEAAALFDHADRLLADHEQAALDRAFDAVEERAGGAAGRDVLLALAAALTEACRALGGTGSVGGREVAAGFLRRRHGAVAPGDNLARAAAMMESFGARELPVLERGALVGILARRDMEVHRGHYEWTTVESAMTRDPVTVGADTPIERVARVLVEHGFNAVPVVTHGALLGMVSRTDLLRVLSKT
ncbi:MAG TPA: CBS domain-containing protein [Candidatus Binatia bacterium]|nr:CBS domain-containing protein [Candidatus Binatia bacterium]